MKEKLKKVVIRMTEDGQIQIISNDPGVAIVLQYPDGAEVDVTGSNGKDILAPKGKRWKL